MWPVHDQLKSVINPAWDQHTKDQILSKCREKE